MQVIGYLDRTVRPWITIDYAQIAGRFGVLELQTPRIRLVSFWFGKPNRLQEGSRGDWTIVSIQIK